MLVMVLVNRGHGISKFDAALHTVGISLGSRL